MPVLLKDDPAIGKAHEVYKSFTADERLMDMAEAREKWRRDVASRLETARNEGLQQGIRQGRRRTAEENAGRMLAKGFPVEDIAEVTGLTAEEMEGLR